MNPFFARPIPRIQEFKFLYIHVEKRWALLPETNLGFELYVSQSVIALVQTKMIVLMAKEKPTGDNLLVTYSKKKKFVYVSSLF